MSYQLSAVHFKDDTKYRVAFYNEDNRVTSERIFNTKEEAESFLTMKGISFTEQ